MKKMLFISLLGFVSVGNAAQANSCLAERNLLALDSRYESALQNGDIRLLNELLAADFIWVHNLASMKETKTQLIARVQLPAEQPKARRAHDISVQRLANTAVLQGLSSVEKWNGDGKSFRTARYQFMRTYVELEGQCKLLAVQTMKVWSSESN